MNSGSAWCLGNGKPSTKQEICVGLLGEWTCWRGYSENICTQVLRPALATDPRTRAVCPAAATGIRMGSAGMPGVHATWAVAMASTPCSVLRRGRWVRSVLMQSLRSFTLQWASIYLLESDGSRCHCKKLLRMRTCILKVMERPLV